ETKLSFTDEESETLLRGFLSGELFRRGLICRADDRGDPVIQLAPPLIAGPEHFEEIESVLRPVLEEASRRMLHTLPRRRDADRPRAAGGSGRGPAGGGGERRRAGPLGPHLGGPGPHALAVGRRGVA